MTVNKNELVKKIKYHFGLNIYESKVYVALLTKNVASVSEVAELSGVPRSRVYDVLEGLEKKGFAMSKLDKPVKYIAVKPEAVIEKMKNNLLREAEDRVNLMSNIKVTDEYKELELLHKNGITPYDVMDLSSAIKGRQNIYSQMKEMLSNAEKEVVLITGTEALKAKISFLKPIFENLKKKGISIKVAASSSEAGNSISEKESLSLTKELGVPVRKVKLNMRMCLVDNKKMLVFLTPFQDEEKDFAVWINSNYLSQGLNAFLHPIWGK